VEMVVVRAHHTHEQATQLSLLLFLLHSASAQRPVCMHAVLPPRSSLGAQCQHMLSARNCALPVLSQVGEDVAIDSPGLAGRRGLAGTVLVHKVRSTVIA
jgi:hypothetical protein